MNEAYINSKKFREPGHKRLQAVLWSNTFGASLEREKENMMIKHIIDQIDEPHYQYKEATNNQHTLAYPKNVK